MSLADPFHVLVSGVPFACQDRRPDETWMTPRQVAQVEAVSPRIVLHHLSPLDLNAGRVAPPPPHAFLVETAGIDPGYDEMPSFVSGAAFTRMISPDLRFVQSCSAGVEHLMPLVPDGVTVCNASGVHANAIAETAMAVILGRAKMLEQRRHDQAARVWRQLPCREVVGATIAILGVGRIGSAVARLAQAFGMRTIGIRRGIAPAEYFDTVVGVEDRDDALGDADYLVVACPLTSQTRGLIGAHELSALKEGAFLLNVARGAIVDEAAMLDALGRGWLSGAFLDAHIQEPLPPEHPLWGLPGVFISPHDSHASQLMGDRHISLFCENLRRVLADEPLLNVVEFGRGY
ncbi:MAG TPA: D-2-hydroxyacid dehydrogenase [Acidimicrobiales bacterium]|nr:D-2-hydroxyacid dehydrogenase [Acidimicrobiales bacterium]